MDYGQISKDTLMKLLQSLPNTPDNQAVYAYLQDLVQAGTVQAIPYTYNVVYWLTGANNALAAGAANTPANLSVQADADFLILNQTFVANTANAAQTANSEIVSPNIQLYISDTGSNMAWMDQAVPVGAIFGTGKLPYVLPEPKLVKAKSTIQVLATNNDAAAGYNLRLAFNGVKLYQY